jgi:hypothetical protein
MRPLEVTKAPLDKDCWTRLGHATTYSARVVVIVLSVARLVFSNSWLSYLCRFASRAFVRTERFGKQIDSPNAS